MIRQYTNMFQDSCTSAQNLLKMSGAEQWIQKTGFDARNALRASGIVSDASEADAKTRTDGAAVLAVVHAAACRGGFCPHLVFPFGGVKSHLVPALRRQL